MKITTYTDLRKNLARMMDETSANHEHRLVCRYLEEEDGVEIAQCRYHY